MFTRFEHPIPVDPSIDLFCHVYVDVGSCFTTQVEYVSAVYFLWLRLLFAD
jgi:hypothetical protein